MSGRRHRKLLSLFTVSRVSRWLGFCFQACAEVQHGKGRGVLVTTNSGLGQLPYLSDDTSCLEFDAYRPTSNALKQERWDRVGYLRQSVRTNNKNLPNPASLQNNAMNTPVSGFDWTGGDEKCTGTGKRAGSVDSCHVTNQSE